MQFQLTFDYLCPFARNTNEAVVRGLEQGRDWDVTFRPFSLSQTKVEEGAPDVFDDPEASGVRALHWGIAVRDLDPERFPAAHLALFAARHDDRLDIRDEDVIRRALEPTGVDLDAVAENVASGKPAARLADEHTEAVDRWSVFGVPTFITEQDATFVRQMDRGSVEDVDRVIEMLEWTSLNEFKRTQVPR